MTLPKTPLKEWLPSSSSPQNVDQRGGSCRILLSSPSSPRKRPPKSPPSPDPEDGEKWLQEAKALRLQNALQTLIKALFGSSCGLSCGQHTGRKSPEIRGRCYTAATVNLLHYQLQYCMRLFVRPHGRPRTRNRRFRCQFRLALRCQAP